MGKKAAKESCLQKSIRFQQQAATLQMKGLYQDCCKILKDRPDILPTVWQHITNLINPHAAAHVPGGGDPSASSDQVAMSATPTTAPPAQSPDGKSSAAAARSPEAEALASSHAGPETCLPNCYRSFEACSVVQLKKFCAAVEPNLFGPFALKAMIKRGSREVNKESLLRILEFTTGLDPSTSISSDERDLSSLERQLVDMNTRFGRRALELNLPPDWAKEGVYLLYKEDEDKIYVGNRFDKQRRLLPEKFLGFSLDQVYIDFNWSDNRAIIRVRGAFIDQPVNLLFAVARQGTSHEGHAHKKPKLMPLPLLSPGHGVGERGHEEDKLPHGHVADNDGLPSHLMAGMSAAAEIEAALPKPLQHSKEEGFVPPGA